MKLTSKVKDLNSQFKNLCSENEGLENKVSNKMDEIKAKEEAEVESLQLGIKLQTEIVRIKKEFAELMNSGRKDEAMKLTSKVKDLNKQFINLCADNKSLEDKVSIEMDKIKA